jgi:hypothetical protein
MGLDQLSVYLNYGGGPIIKVWDKKNMFFL